MVADLIDSVALGCRLRDVRAAAGISQEKAGAAIGVSQPTYQRIEAGERPLKGDELVLLADLLNIRAGRITGVVALGERVQYAARTDGTQPQMAAMREKLHAYLELDAYLTDQGLASA